MFNVCPNCGLYSDEKAIDPAGPFAICPDCGHRHPFVRLPLFVITGASGVGKSTVCLQMAGRIPDCLFFEGDILWRTEFARPEDEYRDFRNICLRVAKGIMQNGRPVVLCGSSTPGQYEACPEFRYFDGVHYLALVCNTATLTRRLKERPAWRNSSGLAFVETMVDFNQWFFDNAERLASTMTLLDTSDISLQQTCRHVTAWLRTRLEAIP